MMKTRVISIGTNLTLLNWHNKTTILQGEFNMNNEVLQQLKDALERRYGSLENSSGCVINGSWLSVENIVSMIDRVDRLNP